MLNIAKYCVTVFISSSGGCQVFLTVLLLASIVSVSALIGKTNSCFRREAARERESEISSEFEVDFLNE